MDLYRVFHLKSGKNKYYFRITFCSDLICNKILMVRNSLKPGFSIRNILLQFVSGVFGLLEKQAFNGLLKVIGIQKIWYTLS